MAMKVALRANKVPGWRGAGALSENSVGSNVSQLLEC